MRIVVFDNGRLGMVKLEQEQGGLPGGTVLKPRPLAAVARAMGLEAGGWRTRRLEPTLRTRSTSEGPVLVDVVTSERGRAPAQGPPGALPSPNSRNPFEALTAAVFELRP